MHGKIHEICLDTYGSLAHPHCSFDGRGHLPHQSLARWHKHTEVRTNSKGDFICSKPEDIQERH